MHGGGIIPSVRVESKPRERRGVRGGALASWRRHFRSIQATVQYQGALGWRNIANPFLGFRGALGQEKNDWNIDLLAIQPLQRDLFGWDEPFDDRWIYGVIPQYHDYVLERTLIHMR